MGFNSFPSYAHDDGVNDERNDDVLMTVVKIMITITAVSSQMHNSVCSGFMPWLERKFISDLNVMFIHYFL